MTLIKTLLLLTSISLATSFSTIAITHDGGHGAMNSEKAIILAQTSAKTLTFKSEGMSVGKLDKSWNNVAKSQFTLVEENEKNIIVKATNQQNKQTLYFNVNKDGTVSDVTESSSVKKSHGHEH